MPNTIAIRISDIRASACLLLRPFDVGAVFGENDDLRAGHDMRRHHGANAVGEHRGLERARCGLPFDDRFGVRDFQRHPRRQHDGDRKAVVLRQPDFHVFLQVGRHVADHVRTDVNLVERLRVHEDVVIAVLIEEVLRALLDERLLQGVGGLVALVDLHAVRDAPHFELRHRRALAGMDVLRGQNDIKLAVLLHDMPFADIACNDGNQSHLYPETAGVIAGEQPMSKQAQDGETSPFWSPQVHADRRPALLQRNRMKTAFRGHFEAEGFTEVECGALAVSPGNEAHLHAFETRLVETGGVSHPLYLHTSPEFAAKKLLAAGETRIFDFARVFRNRERTRLHAPEFTMLEWYRAREPYETVIEDTLTLIRLAADTTGIQAFSFRDTTCDPRATAERLTVAQAFTIHAGIDLLATLSPEGEGDRDRLSRKAQ